MSVIVAARRSPVVPRYGALRAFMPHDLVVPLVHRVLADAGLSPEDTGEMILSNALGAGGNPARLAALAAGLPERVAGLTIDRQCAGGLDAILLADALVRAGRHDIVIAGGVESASRRPLRYRTRDEGPGRPAGFYDQAPFTPWPARDPDMAVAADRLAQTLGIDRQQQDGWAMASHRAALAAGPDPGIVTLGGLDRDPFARPLSPRLAARAPVIAGSITAANMAVAADGAAIVVVASERVAGPKGVTIVTGRTVGGAPECPGLAPVAAIRSVLDETGLGPGDLSAAAIMEAFAVQAMACQDGAGLPRAIVNPRGGALARGHPVGASGAVLAVDLVGLLDRQPGFGLAAIAAAGGIGTAIVLHSPFTSRVAGPATA